MRTMRHYLMAALCVPMIAQAQTLVSTSPMPKTALLEEFTAINCPNCPTGHSAAAAIETQHGAAFTTIGIHGGSLAAPSGGQQDFRTTAGNAIWTQFGVFSQPKGLVNRGGLTNSGTWAGQVQTLLGQTSPVNIGASSAYDGSSQMLTVNVELYYTGQGGAADDRIFVALTEDHITEWQSGGGANYDHRHVLRDFLSPVTGDPVTTTTVGTLVQRSYTLMVDPTWNVSELYIVAYVGEENGEVHQVKEIEADGGITTTVTEFGAAGSLIGDPYPQPATDQVSFPVSDVTTATEFRLLDATGRSVESQVVPAGVTLIDVSVTDLPSGLYFGSFIGGEVRRVIIAH